MIAISKSPNKGLTLEQELALGKRIQENKFYRFELLGTGRTKKTSYLTEEGINARNTLVEHYIHLSQKFAYNFFKRNPTISLQEFLSESQDALMHAADKYTPERGNKFSTFAYMVISQKLRKLVFNEYKRNQRQFDYNGSFQEDIDYKESSNHRYGLDDAIIKTILKNSLTQLSDIEQLVLKKRFLTQKPQTTKTLELI